MSRTLRWLALVVLLLTPACGSGDAGSDGPERQRVAGPDVAKGPVTVFAAASLTEAFTDLGETLQRTAPDLEVRFNFAGSGALAAQIDQGAPADVVATADTASMGRLVEAGLVEPPRTFARSALAILVEPGNPRAVRALADLARSDLKVVLCDEDVPAGRYATQALRTAGVQVRPVSEETDVKSAVAKVTAGEADATIVYVTDVRAAGARATGIEIPAAQNVVAEYPIAVVRATSRRATAAAFVEAVLGRPGRAVLEERGFVTTE